MMSVIFTRSSKIMEGLKLWTSGILIRTFFFFFDYVAELAGL